MRTCGQSWSRQKTLLGPLLGCLTFVLHTDRAVQRLWPDTLRRYMNEAHEYYTQLAGLQEL